MTTTSACALLSAAIHEWWGEERLIREDSDMRATDYLATPSGQHLAAIVDAAVAFVGWMDDEDNTRGTLETRLAAAIDAAGAPR